MILKLNWMKFSLEVAEAKSFLLVMGQGQKFWPGLGRVNFLLLGSGHPSLVWVWVWKISPKNTKFFFLGQIKSLRVSRLKAG